MSVNDVTPVRDPRWPERVEIYDTTLRDGSQLEGISLTVDDKLRIAEQLDWLGVDFIEAGWPGANPKDDEFFRRAPSELPLDYSTLVAFGSTRRVKGKVDSDDTLRNLLAAGTSTVCIVGKAWDYHVLEALGTTLDEGVAMVADSVAFLKADGRDVMYDAEHFFDGYRDDPEYSVACLRAAARAGAERVVLCDTNGSSLPHQIADAVRSVHAQLGDEVAIGIHCHNDLECGVANTLVAVAEGATQVQGTMNGIGERTGNANLVTIIANLELRLGHTLLGPERMAKLTETAHFVDELLNKNPDPRAAWVGRSAFAHKGGLHVAGIRADAKTFEHSDPSVVGNERELLVSELAGKHTVLEKAQAAGLSLDDAAATRVIERVKELEHRGYQFEAADGSFELLLRQEAGEYEPLFRLESWRVIVEQRADGKVETEATIKVWLDGERYVTTAEGNGPVNALDAALRAAIVQVHPHLADVQLVNFKVRILDETHGTDAVTRVFIDASDGTEVWGSTGVHENVIAASWQALVDSLEFAEQGGAAARRRRGAAKTSELPSP
jgi:2-isopropylmalate synthase